MEIRLEDILAANEAKDEAIQRVDRHADPEWKQEAMNIVWRVSARKKLITSDDLWNAGLAQPREPRALGAIFKRAQGRGWIEPSLDHKLSVLSRNHRRPIRIWRSLICYADKKENNGVIELRDYQDEAVGAVFEYLHNKKGNPLINLPTGSGKSIVMAEMIKRAVRDFPATRFLVLAHVKELVAQNHSEFTSLCPGAPAGIYSAGLGRRDKNAQVLFAGIQSVHRKADDLGRRNLVFVDEAHMVPKRDGGMYRRLITDLAGINPHTRHVGLTATPYRLDSGLLTAGDDALFTSVVYDADIVRLIDEGWLSPLVSHKATAQYDTTGISTRGGEFSLPELNQRLEQSEQVTRDAVDEMLQEGQNRRSWLVFCASVKQAHFAKTLLKSAGVETELITGKTEAHVRDSVIKRFKTGHIRCLVNVNVLTTGFNAPATDLIALMRPTKSAGLYVQMLGRGGRTADGKRDCLVLDFGGNIARHGPINNIRPPLRRKGMGEMPIKSCPNCFADVPAGVASCPECEFEFPPNEVALEERSYLDVIARNKRDWVNVERVEYHAHRKKKGKDADGKEVVSKTLRVDYFGGLNRIASEFIGIEHGGYAQDKAYRWLARRLPADSFPPASVDAAVAMGRDLLTPKRVMLDTSGKHPSIISYDFKGEEANDGES